MPQYYDDVNLLPSNFYLFSYGANNLKQLGQTFNYNTNINLTNTLILASIGYNLKGYKRIFFGNSSRWEGAVATIQKCNLKSCVRGILTKIENKKNNYFVNNNRVNFNNLLRREEFPSTYIIEQVGKYNNIPIIAFIKNPLYYPKSTKRVSSSYIIAILKTIIDSFNLSNVNIINKKLILEICYENNCLSSKFYKFIFNNVNEITIEH